MKTKILPVKVAVKDIGAIIPSSGKIRCHKIAIL
jgi:hypothetical protein